MAGLLVFDEGSLWRFGKRVEGRSAKQRVNGGVALVFQDPEDQFFGSEVAADLAWGLAQQGVEGQVAHIRICEALSWVGLSSLQARAISSLSFGERKRLALASALVTQPEILLCDEPTMGLDPASSRLVLEALEAAQRKRPMTVLSATHDFVTLPALVTQAVLLREGRVVFNGTSSEALTLEQRARAALV